MILGVGIDTIDIKRFASWHTYSQKKLSRIFSAEEIEYCLENQHKSGERFAVRFAAREALYKALCAAFPNNKFPFLTICTHTSIKKVGSIPILMLRAIRGTEMIPFTIHISLSHAQNQAIAFVLLEKK